MKKESIDSNLYSKTREYSISRFHFIRHIFALVLTGGFCLSLAMSELTHRINAHHIHAYSSHSHYLDQFIWLYVLMFFFVGIIAITTILTACKIKFSQTGIEISNLFWHEKLASTDLLTYRSPPNFKYAWLRTKHVLYLLAKNEFKDWLQLEETLKEYLSNR